MKDLTRKARALPVLIFFALLLTRCAGLVDLGPGVMDTIPKAGPLATLPPEVIVLIATPTQGPDYNATRASFEIQAAANAAANEAAGKEAFRLAGLAELERQVALSTIQAIEADVAATYAAEVQAVELDATTEALELAAVADRATATRQAHLAGIAQDQADIEARHAAAIRAKDREAEIQRATVRQWTRPLSAAALPVLLFGFVTTAVLLMVRAALARHLADDILDVIARVTGHFAPYVDSTAVQIPSTNITALDNLATGDTDMLDMLHFSRRSGSLAYNKLRAAGYRGGGPKWQSLVERLATDPRSPGAMGWCILDATGGSKRYILRAGVGINDVLSAYGGFNNPPTPMMATP